MTTTLHAHVATAAADCDGTMYREWVACPNDAERANESWGDMLFRERMLTNHVSLHTEYGVSVKVTADGFEMHETTDEGHRVAEVRWCEDEECDPNSYSQRDVYAEMMGY